MDELEIIDALARVGLRLIGGLNVADLVRRFQGIHGLKTDGFAGPVTQRFLDMPRFCGVRDRETVAGQRCRWDHTTWDGSNFSGQPTAMGLNYFVGEPAPGLTQQQTEAVAAAAFAEIAAHGAVRFTPITTPTGANVIIKFGQIDGPSATLAYTELPCGPDTPAKLLDFLADNAEPWVDSADPPNGKIDFRRVLIHEMLHLMGLEHGPQGCIMAPYYDRSIRTMQAWDIQELQLRYGPPITAPAPPVTPPVNPLAKAVIDVLLPTGVKYHGELDPTTA